MQVQTKVNPEEVVRRYVDAYNRHDLHTFAALYDPNIVIFDPIFPEPIKGKEIVQKINEDLFKAFPDLERRILSIMAKGDTVATEEVWAGTFKESIPFSGRIMPPTGRHFESKCAAFLRFNPQGLIAEAQWYYDTASFRQQLGL
ncbi:MAG TPA: ester cyclase [Nitrososphaerales archaeon]|nr:ester cyclase [Nitrososphaerales archaeon]